MEPVRRAGGLSDVVPGPPVRFTSHGKLCAQMPLQELLRRARAIAHK